MFEQGIIIVEVNGVKTLFYIKEDGAVHRVHVGGAVLNRKVIDLVQQAAQAAGMKKDG